jgi:membrane-associated HD superfamily phosphohydrolase
MALPNDSALVPTSVYKLNNMKALNKMLLDINKKIIDSINDGQPLYDSQQKEQDEKMIIININNDRLKKERDELEAKIKVHTDMDKAISESNMYANKNYYILISMFIVVICIIYFLIRISSESPATTPLPSQENMIKMFVLFIIISVPLYKPFPMLLPIVIISAIMYFLTTFATRFI